MRRRLAGVVLALAVAGSGCSGAATTPDSPVGGPTTTPQAATTSAAAPSPSPTPSATPFPTPRPAPAADCAVERCVALTFDDGPADGTPVLLDAFESRGARATLFLIGSKAAARPDIVRDAYARGFEIANHTWSHPVLDTLPADVVADELRRTSDQIEQITGRRPLFMRPPYGRHHAETNLVAGQQGLAVVDWNLTPEDWKNATAEPIVHLTTTRISRNAIVLMHDALPQTVEAAPAIIDNLQAQGYRLVTVSQLLGTTQPGTVYPR